MKISPNAPCPCHSGKKYKKCCAIYHKGTLPKTAQELMRSRYCAFALKKANYIIQTTHQENSDFTTQTHLWEKQILDFCNSCEFQGLQILQTIDGPIESYVTFKATIFCDGQDNSFTEKSKFLKQNGKWLYHSGTFLKK